MDAIRKAEALIEACSYIRRFRDRLTVIKLGGSAMEEPAALTATLQDVVFMETAGMRPVLVHGGGKAIDRAMAAAGLQPRKVQGRRYTDTATLRLVVRTLLEENNADLVKQIRALGGRAVGLHSGPLQSLFGRRLTLPGTEGPIDLGHVGHVSRVEGALLEDLCAGGVIPVVPSLAVHEQGEDGESGGWLNVNADTAAAAIAAELKAEKLVFLTDMPGILRDRNDPESLVPSLDPEGCHELIRRGVIDSGMIPKVEACLDSLRAGVRKVHMIDGRVRHSLLLEIYTDRGVGTEITLAGRQ
jgi:acetylglutamate kinase